MKKLKFILLAVAGLFALVLVTVLFLHSWLPGVLSEKIEDEIRTGLNPDSIALYEVETQLCSFIALFRTTSFSEIRLKPKDTVLLETDANLLPRQIFEAVIYDLRFSSWTLISLALGWKDVKVNRFSVDSIFFAIYNNESGTEKTDSAQSSNLEHLYLDNINTNKLRIEKRSLADDSRQVLQTGRIGFTGEISFYDEEQDHFLNPGINAHSIMVLDADSYSSNGLYTFCADSFLFDGKSQIANLNGLRISPRHSKEEFHKHVQFETDRFDVSLYHIKISGFQQERFIQEGAIALSQIEMNGGKLDVFRDRKPPFNENQRPVMPVRLIQDAPFGLFAGKIIFNNIDIDYSELPNDSVTAGKIPFKQLNATINNISNLKDSLALDHIMNIQAEALIFGKTMLQTEFKYTLNDRAGTYEAEGKLADLSFVDINPALYPLAGVKLIEGFHEYSSVYFYGNDVRSVGEVRMKYSGFKVELIPEANIVLKFLARFIGKKTLYHHLDNPADGEELRVGEIEFDRDVKRFVFNYWWKSFLSGVKDSMT